jgi:hypothetical protein
VRLNTEQLNIYYSEAEVVRYIELAMGRIVVCVPAGVRNCSLLQIVKTTSESNP